jgi:hypothetical protein
MTIGKRCQVFFHESNPFRLIDLLSVSRIHSYALIKQLARRCLVSPVQSVEAPRKQKRGIDAARGCGGGAGQGDFQGTGDTVGQLPLQVDKSVAFALYRIRQQGFAGLGFDDPQIDAHLRPEYHEGTESDGLSPQDTPHFHGGGIVDGTALAKGDLLEDGLDLLSFDDLQGSAAVAQVRDEHGGKPLAQRGVGLGIGH